MAGAVPTIGTVGTTDNVFGRNRQELRDPESFRGVWFWQARERRTANLKFGESFKTPFHPTQACGVFQLKWVLVCERRPVSLLVREK